MKQVLLKNKLNKKGQGDINVKKNKFTHCSLPRGPPEHAANTSLMII
jgi:hypothetical protein